MRFRAHLFRRIKSRFDGRAARHSGRRLRKRIELYRRLRECAERRQHCQGHQRSSVHDCEGLTMKRSTDRFLTTHTGSLPRPDDLIRMMYAKEEGVPVEAEALAARVKAAVAEVVQRQVKAGTDLVNDGEMSKPSYATYVKDRLN